MMQTLDLEKSGFTIIDFSPEVKKLMLEHIASLIHKKTGCLSADLTECATSVDDATFTALFDKTERIFPDEISETAMRWVNAEIVPQLGGKSASTNAPWPHRQQEVHGGEYGGAYDIYWRLVRPRKRDVGAAHADWQFWDIARDFFGDSFCQEEYDERWKIWVPLYGCDKRNSLQIVPHSHLEEVPFLKVRTADGVVKPDIDKKWLEAKEEEFFCPLESFENRAVMFHDKLVHRGPMNPSDLVRISAEITVLLKK